MILSLTSWALAVALYAISQLQQHGKLRWTIDGKEYSFWGILSDRRKYKLNWFVDSEKRPFARTIAPPSNWYYNTFNVKYKEAFLGSSTVFVFVTDGYHLMQFFFTILFCISAVSYEREFGFWIDLGVYWGVWHIVFPLTYKVFGK